MAGEPGPSIFVTLRRSLGDLFGRKGSEPEPAAQIEPVQTTAGEPGETPRRSTGYLPPLPETEPGPDLAEGAAARTRVDPPRTARMVGPQSFESLKRTLDRIEIAAIPFKGLVVDRLAMLAKLATRLERAVKLADHAETAATAQTLAEAAAVLADSLVGSAVELVRLTGRLDQAVKARDREAAQEIAAKMEASVRNFDAALDRRRQDAVRTGAALARAALAKDFETVARTAPALGRDAVVFACLRGSRPPVEVRAFVPTGALGDRATRLQQALISQDFMAIMTLASEAAIQAGIMADTTVKTAVGLIAEARSIRQAAGSGASAALRELTAKLVQAAPLLTGRLAERMDDLEPQTAELLSALAHKDYAAASSLGWRIALTSQIALHGIVSRATSLATVTTALREAALQGETETITTLLEGI